jgi:hypothetical protein
VVDCFAMKRTVDNDTPAQSRLDPRVQPARRGGGGIPVISADHR